MNHADLTQRDKRWASHEKTPAGVLILGVLSRAEYGILNAENDEQFAGTGLSLRRQGAV